tara:strand:- start:827 stop:1192 length:366 start_codon:yes stop_codon:yes gene_type:complete
MPNVARACKKVGVSRQTFYRWRTEDADFYRDSESALLEGEENMNDFVESQLMVKIKDRDGPSIRYYLNKRHEKYKDKVKEKDGEEFEASRIIQELGLTPEDFTDEHLDETTRKITSHLLKR